MVKTKTYAPRQHQRDLMIMKSVDERGIRLFNYFEDVDEKREILKSIGYRGLRVASDKSEEPFVFLENCSDERISAVLMERYDTAKRRLEEYDSGKRILRGEGRKIPVKEIPSKQIPIPVEITRVPKNLCEQLSLFR